MKKTDQDSTLFTSEISSKKDLKSDKVKTTNVNILLNRVRLDRKRTLRRRIIFSLFLASIISSLTVYFII